MRIVHQEIGYLWKLWGWIEAYGILVRSAPGFTGTLQGHSGIGGIG